jgi:hypothetical protein
MSHHRPFHDWFGTALPILAALVFLAACNGGGGGGEDTGIDDGTDPDADAGGDEGGDPGLDPDGQEDAAPDPDAETDADADAEPDLPPPWTGVCNDDGACSGTETCAACPDECGSCDVETYTSQRAKYVDGACEFMGDGLTDTCAGSDGSAGRFNELQTALESLVEGDTLYVHPGDYYREPDPRPRDSGGIYTLEASGTADRPVIVTAADRADPPTIHSCSPSEPTRCFGPAFAAFGDHVILDHLRIRGRIQIWGGAHKTMQYLECTHGWGACGDGNWSCLRIESCESCTAHHNYVHDVSGAGMCEACLPGDECGDFEDRGAGLKEFSSNNAVWEFNTVIDPPRWCYDLHRNSNDVTIRFNLFEGGGGTPIHIDRTRNVNIYGNVIVTEGEADAVENGCIDAAMQNEASPGDHFNDIHHNTCAKAHWGITVGDDTPSSVHDNILLGLAQGRDHPRNINLPGEGHSADHNAYDADAAYHAVALYDGTEQYDSLSDWQAGTGNDAASIEGPGGACELVDPPGAGPDWDFDLHVTAGACLTLSGTGGEVGAYGLTSCVGHLCP